MKELICLLVLLVLTNDHSMEKPKMERVQGIWSDVNNGYNLDKQVQYAIYKDSLLLEIAYVKNDSSLNFPMFSSFFGFLNYNPKSVKSELDIDSLKKDGDYFVSLWSRYVKNNKANPTFGTVANLSFEDDMLVLFGTRESRWNKIDRLPSFAVGLLYKRGIKDNVDYLGDYLEVRACEVNSSKAIIYEKPDQPTKMYLVKGDVPTVLDESEDWLKIEYLGKKLVTGWIKKSDTDMK